MFYRHRHLIRENTMLCFVAGTGLCEDEPATVDAARLSCNQCSDTTPCALCLLAAEEAPKTSMPTMTTWAITT